eukprot:1981012-Rhodomonas_salina.1
MAAVLSECRTVACAGSCLSSGSPPTRPRKCLGEIPLPPAPQTRALLPTQALAADDKGSVKAAITPKAKPPLRPRSK